MKSKTSPSFRKRYSKLPDQIRDRARVAYKLFRANPAHPSLNLEKLKGFDDLWSARIGLHYRAIAIKQDEIYLWCWIGNHSEFDRAFKS